MRNMLRDVRFGARMFRKNPWFTCAAVTVLALGIGANTAIFSLVNAFLLKPLVVRNPAEVVGCYSRDAVKGNYRGFSYPDYVELRENGSAFSSLLAHNMAMVGLTEGETTRRVFADIVSANYFTTFGVPLFQGRSFSPAEEQPASAIPVVIVSYSYWKKSGSDPRLLGKGVRINNRTYTIVGIAPRDFTGTTALISPDLYLPLGVYEMAINDFEGGSRSLASRNNHDLVLVGRLRSGLSQKSADAMLATVASQLASAYPDDDKNQTFLAQPLPRMGISTAPEGDSGVMFPALLLLAVTGVVLLIASLNVANMMLARGTTRGKEIAIRLALGASRADILRQLLVEGFLLALAGGVAGLAISYWSTDALVHSMSRLAPIDLVYSAGPDMRVLVATIGFCVLSTVLFGLGPAWNLSGWNLSAGLKVGNRADFQCGRGRAIFSRRNLLVMGQVSLSLMLLSAAGLFVRSSVQAARVEPGFRVSGQILAEVDASLEGYNETRTRETYRAVIDRLQTIPGVESVSLAATTPFGMISLGKDVQPSGAATSSAPGGASSGRVVSCRYNVVSANYFQTMGVPLLRGRAFTAQDAAVSKHTVAILDQAAAEKLWPGGGAIGKSVRLASNGGNEPPLDAEVVGVAANIQEDIIGTQRPPHIYVPFGQAYQSDMNIHLMTSAQDPQAEAGLLGAVRREIRAVDPHLPIIALTTLRTHIEGSFSLWIVRTGARMFMIFGGVALLLAAIGLYGVRAYTVAMRTREIGIRMALGARASDALRMMLREGMSLFGIGGAVGLLLSLAVGKVLSSVLYHVDSFDPVALSAAAALLALVSLVACYIPARRAARLDPMVALRDE
ncbi:MAG TPA: ABC transporter permease [Candidatus Acidoferrales bacterium]|nr:ABC transporter permease [Candidatus Acidoferrales bacterium]